MALYTVHADYFATGEGRTLMLLYTYAANEDDARAAFGRAFSPYFALGCEVAEGFLLDIPIADYLLSDKVKEFLRTQAGQCNLDYHSSLHFNYS